MLTAFGLWAAIAAGVPSRLWFLDCVAGGWSVVLGAWTGTPRPHPLPAWNAHAGAGLGFVLLLTLALPPPFARVGERTGQGIGYYRAYSRPISWHTALTAELAKFSMPRGIPTSRPSRFTTTDALCCPPPCRRRDRPTCAAWSPV